MDQAKLAEFKADLKKAKHPVFLTGAGVSTHSGIPDYRSKTGIYNGVSEPPEVILSEETLYDRPQLFYDFVMQNMYFPDAKPNLIHEKIAAICNEKGALITQNIDTLDRQAGNQHVTEFHGNLYDIYCSKCKQKVSYEEMCLELKKRYDGYHFGNTDIYCPWDVINFAKKLVWDPSARPSAFWINSSGNDMVKRFVDKADQTTRDEIEKLVAGGFVEKQLRLDLTYDEIDNTIDNLWSVLFTTGYLTTVGEVMLPDSESYAYKLVIPNKEVREVFVLQIQEWFKAVVAKDDDTMKLLSRAILDKDEKQIARQLNIVMSRMISILDTKASDDMKENFYHGLLLGLLRGSNPGWLIKSNRESGDGFSDILIKPEDPDAGIVIEVKYAKEMKNLDAACEAAMTQIKEKRYDEALRDEGRCDILAYGIAFCRKRCRVVGEKIND